MKKTPNTKLPISQTKPGTRISSGIYKNKKIEVPDSAKAVRERIKQSVFSTLGTDLLKNAKVLDLFAGSGNLGFEALSNGAGECTFIEDDFEAIGIIRKNAELIGIKYSTKKGFQTEDKYEALETSSPTENKARIIKASATKFLTGDITNYDVIFMDPPYDLQVNHILKNIHESITKTGIIVYFKHIDNKTVLTKINPKLQVYDQRVYGITVVDFISKK